ncbi:hypothetical protein [Burkholderia glumae]|uniref:Uncharacterized protein n=2 Tax=Burkholderia glumae TaxID=337 RepID=A0AAQ0BV28_BURGL|nr:hypothetical protein [Burkholderia glumae]AJY67227.1 hypothetical protein KS03_3172 [Burkholderia glumae LMG 2196 = ATCC 33617]MCM2538688.1 hypothetical protein [Burkholderia glumae]QKM55033.1 hypothetical protein CG017_03083 [Burkholderia glumae]QPQ92992.1 hypothetical protein I6H06_11780 [Burkholderia glumae]QQM91806.1 hypothetical protein I6G78_05970 [Burkholderia glumae]
MAEKNINWAAELVAAKIKADNSKTVSHMDEHLVQILSIKRLGFSWDKTADETNRILGLKGLDKVNGKKLARIAAKWKAAGLIDLKKVDAFHEQVKKALERKSAAASKPAPPLPQSIPSNFPPQGDKA